MILSAPLVLAPCGVGELQPYGFVCQRSEAITWRYHGSGARIAGPPRLLRGLDIQAQLKSTVRRQDEGLRKGDEYIYVNEISELRSTGIFQCLYPDRSLCCGTMLVAASGQAMNTLWVDAILACAPTSVHHNFQ